MYVHDLPLTIDSPYKHSAFIQFCNNTELCVLAATLLPVIRNLTLSTNSTCCFLYYEFLIPGRFYICKTSPGHRKAILKCMMSSHCKVYRPSRNVRVGPAEETLKHMGSGTQYVEVNPQARVQRETFIQVNGRHL